MYYFCDILSFYCLFTCGFFTGYYCKVAYIYDNLSTHWHALAGALAALLLAGLWIVKKRRARQYKYLHFYAIFYGCVCLLISGCFMLSQQLMTAFAFGFVGVAVTTVPAYSFISLRSSAAGLRPARIALGNALHFVGLAAGFAIFEQSETMLCSWLLLGLASCLLCGMAVNELLQYLGVNNYKCSCDRAFNLLNEEKVVFLSGKAVRAQFTNREQFYLERNVQWLLLPLAALLLLERLGFYCATHQLLAWRVSYAYAQAPHVYASFVLYAAGCCLGALLLLRYSPPLVYIMFALINVTATVALLGVYAEQALQQCFYFVCLHYVSLGVYSSSVWQVLLECTHLLYTELALAAAFAFELLGMELLKSELMFSDSWTLLLSSSLTHLVLSLMCCVFVQLLVPKSCGLIEMRNRLMGVRRHPPAISQSRIWHSNCFTLAPHEVNEVKFAGNRVFQQYPREL